MVNLRLPYRPPEESTGERVVAHRRARPQKVLFLDNAKLDPRYGNYGVIFVELRAELARRIPESAVVDETRNLLLDDLPTLYELADDVLARDFDAAVIALCDTGVSQPTAILAAELERRDIPTVLVGQGIGVQLATTTLRSLGSPLEVFGIDAIRTATSEQVRAEVDAIRAPAINSLLSEPATSASGAAGDTVAGAAGAVDSEATALTCLPDDTDAGVFHHYMTDAGIGDGLPMVVPTSARVEAMLTAAGLEASDEIWPTLPPRDRPLSALDLATVAVMAGCEPAWMWAVVAAYRALADPGFRLFQAAITTHPSGTLVLVSGALAERSGIASGPGCLGPGFPANATIGRAVALAGPVLFGARPGGRNLTRLGSPAGYTYCCAENVGASPWPGFHEDIGGADVSTVTVLKCEGPRNVLDNLSMTPESLLTSIARTMTGIGSNNSFNPFSHTVVFLNPEHAQIVADAGWTKQDVQRFLFEVARVPQRDLEGRGSLPKWPVWFAGVDPVPIVQTPDDILVVVVGGPGPQSMVALPWGLSRGTTVVVH